MTRRRKYPWPELIESGELAHFDFDDAVEVDRMRKSAYMSARAKGVKARTSITEVRAIGPSQEPVRYRLAVQFAADVDSLPEHDDDPALRFRRVLYVCPACHAAEVLNGWCSNPACEFYGKWHCGACGGQMSTHPPLAMVEHALSFMNAADRAAARKMIETEDARHAHNQEIAQAADAVEPADG